MSYKLRSGFVSNMQLLTTIVALCHSRVYTGKWHLGMHGSNEQDFAKSPVNQGFDYFYGLPLTNLKDFGDTGETVRFVTCTQHCCFLYLYNASHIFSQKCKAFRCRCCMLQISTRSRCAGL